MKLSKVILGLSLLLNTSLHAQFSPPDKSAAIVTGKSSSYLFPIKPGSPALLTGTMGELRNTHFHAGLDIDTPGVGVPVFAANDGYISRATFTTGGYGNVLYVTHPDGNTTLYAHLDDFKGAIGEHIRLERYKRKTAEFDFVFEPNQFPVTKGDVIALSGNTGGSGGPHLHFEIRNSNNEAINPLVYGFSEVNDNLGPVAFKIALKTLDDNSRINDQFGRFEFSLIRQGTNFIFPTPVMAHGNIGVEILAHDKAQNSRFSYGINTIELYVSDKINFRQTIDHIKFPDSRRILTLMDYRTLEQRGARFNKLYVDDGNTLNYYPDVKNNAVQVTDGEVPIKILLKDYFGNTTSVLFNLKHLPIVKETTLLGPAKVATERELIDNTLKLTVKRCSTSTPYIELWENGKATTMEAMYEGQYKVVYLVNLKKHLPDSIKTCQETIILNYKDRIPSNSSYNYYSKLIDLEFPELSVYDTTYLTINYDTIQSREIFGIGSRYVPLHAPIEVTLKPNFDYTISRDLGVYLKEGRSLSYVPSEWRNNKVSFKTRSYGDFTMLRDSIPPTITPVSITNASARLKIRDNLSGISYYEANINGEWLLMIYDYKTGYIKSEKLDKNKPLKGEFELKVVDMAGNEKIFKQKII